METPRELAILSKAATMLAEIKSVDQIKDIRDKAEAVRMYMKQRGYGLDAQNDAAEIKIRAERRAGEILSSMEKHRGRPKEKGSHDVTVLKEIGVEKMQSHRWQQIASIPEEKFEKRIAEVKSDGELTTSSVLTLAKVLKNKTRNEATKTKASSTVDLANLIETGSKFACIYADPPWRYGNQATRAATDNHYPTMTVEEIAALPIDQLSADRAHLWLWTTNGFLFECPKIFEAWGFEFKSSYVWVKSQMGIGNYLRNSHELLLLAVRGGMTAAARDVMSWGEFPRAKHSAKPEEIRRKVVERISPGPRLELFGRNLADGWTVWGNQIGRTMFDGEAA